MTCPECGSGKVTAIRAVPHANGVATYWRCKTCKAEWQTG
jgi:formate dehydrogenase maturation protein FdhE